MRVSQPLRCVALTLSILLPIASPVQADEVTRYVPEGAFIAQSVVVPAGYETIYISGLLPPQNNQAGPLGSTARYGGGTEAQAELVFKRLEEALAVQNLGLGDVVMMRVYLAGDPAQGGAMDFAGMMAAYKRYFGTPTQPNKPARATMQVAGLVGGPGPLIEVEAQAVRRPK
jgi:enamine deaminase RidA (YjgF/YER057c/UK114 family)